MNTRSWPAELTRFRRLSQMEQLVWLSQVLYLVSMLARDTYEAGTDDVSRPKDLRRFNELLHRIATVMKKVARDDLGAVPDADLFAMIEEELGALGVQHDEVLKRLP